MRLADGMYVGVYPVTPAVIEWLAHGLLPVEQSSFRYWRERIGLVRMAEKAQAGELHTYAVHHALEQYFEDKKEHLTYQECLELSADHIFSDTGEWVVYTEDSRTFILGDYNCSDDALYDAPESLDWVILWMPYDEELMVFRSPHQGMREIANPAGYTDGLERLGETALSYVLPDGIEGAIWQDLRGGTVTDAFDR